MKLDKKLVYLTAVCTLVMVGCQRKEAPQEETVVEEAPPTNMLLPNCDDASVKNALVRELSKNVENDIALYITDYSDASDLELDRRISQRLPEIGIDLQNVSSEAEACQTELHVTLPANDIAYANQQFARTGQPNLTARISDTDVKLDNNRLIAPIHYRINNDTVVLVDKPDILSLVAQISTASTYAIAKSERSVVISQPTVRTRPITPPKPPKPTQAPTPTQDSQDPLVQEYAKQNGIHIESTNTQPPNPTHEPKANSEDNQPTQKEAPAPISDTKSEITIVETDETY